MTRIQLPPRPVSLALAVAGLLATGVVAAGAATRPQPAAVTPAGEMAPAAPSSVAEPPPSTDPPATTATTAAAPRPTATTARPPQPAARPASAEQVVLAFSDAVDRGDAAAAWRLLGPRSQAYWGTEGRFAASLPKLAQGGWAGWRATPDRTASRMVALSSGEGEVLVVTLRGTSSEGTRAAAFPVRHLRGAPALLELWDLGAGDSVPEVVGPSPVQLGVLTTTERTPTFQATGRGRELLWSLDGRESVATRLGGGLASYRPAQALSAGTHVLTVASVGSGWLTAAAVVVQVT